MKHATLSRVGTFLERVTLIFIGASLFGPRPLLIPMTLLAVLTAIFGVLTARSARGENVRRAH